MFTPWSDEEALQEVTEDVISKWPRAVVICTFPQLRLFKFSQINSYKVFFCFFLKLSSAWGYLACEAHVFQITQITTKRDIII